MSDLQQRFNEYHGKNPHVYEAFKRCTLQAIRRGFRNYGANGIVQIIRWETGVTASDPDGFKINNSYAAFYARKFSQQFPQHKDFFRNRSSAADGLV
jgi:hypothetical protein